jgi:triacylglycerol esterase/lipase EstA (alpha/beta hydrolase family)
VILSGKKKPENIFNAVLHRKPTTSKIRPHRSKKPHETAEACTGTVPYDGNVCKLETLERILLQVAKKNIRWGHFWVSNRVNTFFALLPN